MNALPFVLIVASLGWLVYSTGWYGLGLLALLGGCILLFDKVFNRAGGKRG